MPIPLITKRLTRDELVENTEPLRNPYMGFYSLHRYRAELEPDFLNKLPDGNQRLVLVEINLEAFRQQPIPEFALLNIESIIRQHADNGQSLILRFLYDWDGNGLQCEPATIDIILNHMNQLSDLLHRNEAAIYIVQGLFIGNWGEMHGTRYHSKREQLQLYKRLLKCTGASTFLAARCPNMFRYLTGMGIVNGEDINLRLGLFNDAILGSETDLGTYGNDTCRVLDQKWTRDEELAFQEQLCLYVPNGGEIISSVLSGHSMHLYRCLKQMHVSYLNSEYDARLITDWKARSAGVFSSSWSGRSVYNYLGEHLGFRFLLSEVKASYSLIRRMITFSCTVNNAGTAPCYRSCVVMLSAQSADNRYSVQIDTDLRKWLPDKPVVLSAVLCIPEKIPKKTLELAICICDDNGNELIRFANTKPNQHFLNPVGSFIF